MKPNQLAEKDALALSKIIAATAEVLSGLAVIEIAAGIKQDQGIQKIAGEGLRAAHEIDTKIESMLRAGGWEIRHTSPMVRSLVRLGTGLHESLENAPDVGGHVGAVGEGSMPETPLEIMARTGFEVLAGKHGPIFADGDHDLPPLAIQQKPVTGKNKPVTGRLGRSK